MCHCGLDKDEHKAVSGCSCNGCNCGVIIEDTNGGGGVVIDDTNECETCQ